MAHHILQNPQQKEKRRTPAWTDRILHRSPAGAVKQTHYSSANLLVSDHKPVSSKLTLTVKALHIQQFCDTSQCPSSQPDNVKPILRKLHIVVTYDL